MKRHCGASMSLPPPSLPPSLSPSVSPSLPPSLPPSPPPSPLPPSLSLLPPLSFPPSLPPSSPDTVPQVQLPRGLVQLAGGAVLLWCVGGACLPAAPRSHRRGPHSDPEEDHTHHTAAGRHRLNFVFVRFVDIIIVIVFEVDFIIGNHN